MPEARSTMPSSVLAQTTPVPNWLLDEVLPLLGDTELRVLLVVVRSTLGWQDGMGRKESDWLSHRQLQTRTGRSSAVVSRAVDGLVRRKLIAVTNAKGEPLLTAQARSRAQGRLFYRLVSQKGNRGQAHFADAAKTRGRSSNAMVSRGDVPGDTLESEANGQHDTLSDADCASESEALKAKVTSETTPQKVRTTKETGTKEIKNTEIEVINLRVPTLENEVSRFDIAAPLVDENPNGQTLPALTDLENAGNASFRSNGEVGQGSGEDVTPFDPKSSLEISPEMSHLIGVFRHLYAVQRPGCEMPPLRFEDYTLLQRRLAQHGVEELEAWLLPFFKCSFSYVRRREWSLGSYLESLTILQTSARRKGELSL